MLNSGDSTNRLDHVPEPLTELIRGPGANTPPKGGSQEDRRRVELTRVRHHFGQEKGDLNREIGDVKPGAKGVKDKQRGTGAKGGISPDGGPWRGWERWRRGLVLVRERLTDSRGTVTGGFRRGGPRREINVEVREVVRDKLDGEKGVWFIENLASELLLHPTESAPKGAVGIDLVVVGFRISRRGSELEFQDRQTSVTDVLR